MGEEVLWQQINWTYVHAWRPDENENRKTRARISSSISYGRLSRQSTNIRCLLKTRYKGLKI